MITMLPTESATRSPALGSESPRRRPLSRVVPLVELTVRRNILTAALVSTFVVTGVLTHGFRGPSRGEQRLLGTGFGQVVEHGRWWTPLTSVLLTNGGFELAFVLLCVIVFVGISERVMGPLRSLLAFTVTAILGPVVGITAQAIGNAAGEIWSLRVSQFISIDPMTAVAGVSMTATAFVGRLWRRRVRVLLLSTMVVFLLYGGQPSDLYRLCGAVAGLGLGYALRPSDGTPLWPRSSHN
jgi:phosphatidylglycerol lysyltransferase